MSRLLAAGLAAQVLSGALGASAQPSSAKAPGSTETAGAEGIAEAIGSCVKFLLSVQEGEGRSEWPYEGVYRVGGEIPVGYRIGGTALVAVSLLRAPGFADDAERVEAVRRALDFVIAGLDEPLMKPEYAGGYDVRGWGYTYALGFMLAVRGQEAAPKMSPEAAARLDERIRWCIRAIEQTEIPEAGGWNYARARSLKTVSPPSPFMTGPTLMALFEARQQGFAVDAGVVERGLAALERGRAPSGSVSYSGDAEKRPEPVPGSVGRMLVCENTLLLAGRSDLTRLRGAIDAFLVHWDHLDKRRAKPGTHVPPYGVAPYYFYYAHEMAAEAIERLPARDRAEYRRRLHERIFSVRQENGAWNDRVFDRTANYGTSRVLMCLLAPDLPARAAWKPELALPPDAGGGDGGSEQTEKSK